MLVMTLLMLLPALLLGLLIGMELYEDRMLRQQTVEDPPAAGSVLDA